ncbi:MAG: Hydrolase, alpha/beta fold family protein [Phenylobacterium sp.]|nr:Hydrolase, alpha/beta fold family protein [Phenylobacterium sp.]
MAAKRGGLGKALFAAAGLVAGAFVVRGAIQRAGRAKAYLAQGIDEKTWITLGGIEQWVTIRGRDLSNPVLLVLHGGPGSAISTLAPKLFAGWEDHFTVVNWDQRGAGRTFARNGKDGSGPLTIGRMVVDGIELAEELKRRLPGAPIILFGISWGSVLGVEMLRAKPDLFCAYAASGQLVDMGQGETLSYFGTIDRLRARSDERGAKALEAIGPPPYPDLKSLAKQRQLLVSTMPGAERHAFRDITLAMLTAPDGKLGDFLTLQQATRFSVGQLWGPLQAWRLEAGGLTFETPMVFFQGDADLHTPTALVSGLAPQLKAPAVEFVLIEDAGHFAVMTHGDRLRREFVERLRPFALGKVKKRKKAKG